MAGLAGAVALQAGCLIVAAGAAGAGTVAYVKGELEASLDASYRGVVNASGRAIDALELHKISENGDATRTVIVARTADDRRVHITVNKVADSLTKVSIRVGTFGDETLSRTILDRIKQAL